MPSEMKIVRPLPSPAILSTRIRKNIKKNLTPLMRQNAFYRQVLVAGWQPQHQPKFRGTVTFDSNTVSADILIINGDTRVDEYAPTTINDLWSWWEHTGTKKHKIKPVRAEFLRFEVNNEIVFALVVKHPGTKPKRKTRRMNKKLTGQIGSILMKSVARGMWK